MGTQRQTKLDVNAYVNDQFADLWSVETALDYIEDVYTNGPEHQAHIVEMCLQLACLLLKKNQGYGNSALDPLAVFSRLPARERMRVRMDDKLSRLKRGDLSLDDEDIVMDLAGYLVLDMVARANEVAA